MTVFYKILLFGLVLTFIGCQEEAPKTESPENVISVEPAPEVVKEAIPPTPPIFEDFQGEPKLSLFPRVGDFRPAEGDERLPYWNTFIDHATKVSGLVENPEDGNKAWSFRSVNTIDSLGYFSPLAVEPDTTYRVSFKLKAELPEGATAGLGVLDFNEFIWVGEQYTEELFKEHYRGVHEGLRLTGSIDWQQHNFNFTSGPETRMVHLVMFREGTHDRSGVLFDDIRVDVAHSE
jgi:hypothetical protein